MAFLEKEEMQQGHKICSQIGYAIRTVSVRVIIISLGYTESDWCLNGLLMLKSNVPTIPVFYHVKADAIRLMLCFYCEALQTHEMKGRCDPNNTEN